MKEKPDPYFLVTGIILLLMFLSGTVLFTCVWLSDPPPIGTEQFRASIFVLSIGPLGLIATCCQWRLIFSYLSVDEEGLKQNCILLKPRILRWEDCVECGVCRVPIGIAEFQFYFYASAIPLRYGQKMGFAKFKPDKSNKPLALLNKTWMRIPFSYENYRCLCKYAPPHLVEMLKADPMMCDLLPDEE